MNQNKRTRQDWLVFLFMLMLVPLAGEPKFHPFNGDFSSFRVSFGSPVFLLFLLWLRSFPVWLPVVLPDWPSCSSAPASTSSPVSPFYQR